MTPEQINIEFKRRFADGENELVLSNWYKTEHQKLIDERITQQRLADRTKVYCEKCGNEISTGRGRPPKMCEKCR
jgi:RNA polymerase-binding transcription factor DksA